MQSEFSLIDTLQFLWKKRKVIFLVVGFIVLSTVVVSFFMPDYFKSETIFYAASPDLAEPIPIGGQDKNVRIYGDDSDLDRLFTIALSYELSEFLIDSFDLYTHYDIDTSDSKSSFKVREKLKKNFQTIKTKYRALHLSIEDTDPQRAADMVNAAREKIAEISQKIVKESQQKLLNNYSANLKNKQVQNDTLAKKITESKTKFNIFELTTQAEIYTSLITRAESELQSERGKLDYFSSRKLSRDSINKYASVVMGLENKLKKLRSEMQVFNENVAPIRQMEQELFRNLDQINLDKERYKQLSAAVGAPFTALHLVEAGQVPVQKSRPKRSVWVLLAGFISLVCFSLFLIIQETYKNDRARD